MHGSSHFFGTDRKHVTGNRRIEFTAQRVDQLSLGRAIVTVPRSVNRKLGEILTPTFVERVFFRGKFHPGTFDLAKTDKAAGKFDARPSRARLAFAANDQCR